MRIFFSVGEPSGDLHGANLIRELRRLHPECQCVGFGGPLMAAAGAHLHEDLTQLAVMWFLRVLLNLHRFLGLLWKADRCFRDQRPDAVVLIDYPGFNWWIARRAKARGIPVIYYGTPQLWAWAPWRVRKMRRYVDHVLCKLPFEERWFRDRGCNATYVGHPYFDQLTAQKLDQAFVQQHDSSKPLVVILPGSRTQEVKLNLPWFLRTATAIRNQVSNARFAIASFNATQADLARQQIASSGLSIEVHVGRTPELIHLATCCLACSGSVSLELMYHEKPAVILYWVSQFGMFIQGFFRTVRFITLVNLLATQRRDSTSRQVFDPDAQDAEQVPYPEYLTTDDKSSAMARWMVRWLTDPNELARRVALLGDLKRRYGHPGASTQAARYILKVVECHMPLRACA